MKMRAAVLHEREKPRPYAETRPLAIEQVDLDPPGRGELRVRIRAAGLCHSDLSTINGDRPRPVPMVLGHEAAAEVVETGEGVDDLKPGDRLVLIFVPSCGRCVMCAQGRPALCEPAAAANTAGTLLSGARRLSQHGQPLHHHIGVSCFAEYAVIARESAIKVDDDLDFAEAALFGCAVITGAGAVVNTAKVPPGASVAVVGLGGVGLMALLAAKLSGCTEIVAIDISEQKLQTAAQIGATLTFNAGDPACADKIRAATGGGVDFAFEMAGVVPALEMAWQVTRRGGTTVTASLPNPADRFPLPAAQLVAEERSFKGSYIGSCAPIRDVPRFIQLFRQGLLPVDRLLSETVTLDELNAAFDRLAEGQTVRQILTP